MWFLNDMTIKSKERSETEIISICKDNDIKVGNGWCKNKWLGRVISDLDYTKLMSTLANES